MISRPRQTEQSVLDPGGFMQKLALRMHELVSDHPDFEVLCEPSLDNYCFRYLPNGFVERQEEPEVQELLDCLNQEIIEMVRRSGFASVTTTNIDGRIAIKFSSYPHRTRADGIDATFEAIARWGRLLNKKHFLRHISTSELEVQLCSSESHSSSTEVSAT